MLYDRLIRRRQNLMARVMRRDNAFIDSDWSELDLISDCEALYKGGVFVQQKMEEFLPRPELQTDVARSLMLSIGRVKYVNHFAVVINYFPDFLFSFPLIFKTPENKTYAKFKEDCDGAGTDFQDLIQRSFVEYLVGKRSAIYVGLPRTGREIVSAAESDRTGAASASVKLFGSGEIMDWEVDARGNLKWIILYEGETPRDTPDDDGDISIERYWVCDKEKVQYFEILSTSAKGDVDPTWVWRHGIGVVPVVLTESTDGKWLGEKLRSPCIDNLRSRTALGFHNNKTAYPVVVRKSSETDTKPGIGESGVTIGTDDEINFLVPPADSREALENDTRESTASIYRTANLGFLVDAEKNKPWRSGKAKESDSDAGHVTIKDYGKIVRNMAKAVLQMVARVQREKPEGFDVSGFEKLDEMTLDQYSDILETLSTIDYGVIDSFGETARKQLLQRAIQLALPDIDEEIKQKISKEIETATIVRPQPANAGKEAKKEN